MSRRADAKNDSLTAQAWVAWVLACRGAAPRLRAPPWVEWRGGGGVLHTLMEEFDMPLDKWLRRHPGPLGALVEGALQRHIEEAAAAHA